MPRQPDLRRVEADRVEVLRGPQGTLYGTGALGVVVRIVTVAPDLDRFTGSAAIEGTSVANGGLGGTVEGIVNVPILPGTLALRASGWSETMPGWIDDTGRGRRDVNRTRRIGSRAALRWSFGDWHATLDGVAQRIDARDSQYDVGNANNYGLELGGRRDLAPVAIDFTTTLQRARLTSASSGMKIDDDDRRLPIVPDISARLAASRTFESAACVPKSMRPLVISVAPG